MSRVRGIQPECDRVLADLPAKLPLGDREVVNHISTRHLGENGESFFLRGFAQSLVEAHETSPLRLAVAPSEGRGKLQSVGRPARERNFGVG